MKSWPNPPAHPKECCEAWAIMGVTTLSDDDLRKLANNMPSEGMYDNFRVPQSAVVVGHLGFVHKLNIPSFGILFNNFFLVHEKDEEALIDGCVEQFEELMNFSDDQDLYTGALIGTWSHPNTPYRLIGTFSDLGELSSRWPFPYIDGWTLAHDENDNSIEEIWAEIARNRQFSHFEDVAFLTQQLMLPSALRERLDRTINKALPLLDQPTDDWLALRYLLGLAHEGRWMDRAVPTLTAMVQQHDMSNAVDASKHVSSPKSKM